VSETYAPGLNPEYRAFQDQAAAEVAQAKAADQARQVQARAFQEAGNTVDVPGVGTGGKPD
jgi:hypothetical protein